MLSACCSVAQSCLTLCDPTDCSTPGFLFFTIFRSLLKLMSIELVMPSTTSPSVVPFSSCLQSFPVSGHFMLSAIKLIKEVVNIMDRITPLEFGDFETCHPNKTMSSLKAGTTLNHYIYIWLYILPRLNRGLPRWLSGEGSAY